jgi:hypothetical protein
MQQVYAKYPLQKSIDIDKYRSLIHNQHTPPQQVEAMVQIFANEPAQTRTAIIDRLTFPFWFRRAFPGVQARTVQTESERFNRLPPHQRKQQLARLLKIMEPY